jgi:arginyl-tRNA synthetase
MEEIKQLIKTACAELFNVEVEVVLTRPDEQFGDFATNVALQLSKQVGQNPREVAEQIAVKIRENSVKTVKTVEIAGPGFINITLTDETLTKSLSHGADALLRKEKTVLVEYSDPNPLKPLHAGHLYTTLVGDAIARLVERSGAKTIRLNYGGDVGMHVAKSMWAVLNALGGENPEKLKDIPEEDRSTWLGTCYVSGNNAYEDNEAAKAEITAINKKVYALHAEGDKESAFAQIYWTIRQWSYDYFEVLYSQLGVVSFDRFIPESEVTPLGIQTVKEHTDSVYKESDGAVVFDGEAHGLHTRVFMNSEGLPTYEAKEVGLLETKWNDYHFDESIVITASEQAQYMQVVLKSIEQFQPEPIQRTKHLTHGVVKLAGGVKMSSRKGNIVSALDILSAAREAGAKSGRANDESIILAAVKYAFLKNRIGADIIYDPEESVALEGNSGPYLQYAHARARSILTKATSEPAEATEDYNPSERTLVRKMTEFNEVVNRAMIELMPHHICTYLFELAQEFNRFYEKNQVVGSDKEATRLKLVAGYADILKEGLDLLGIHAPDRM